MNRDATSIEKTAAWWFAPGDRLPHGDNRLIVLGETHSVDGKIVPCKNALHASRHPFDALGHATGPYLYKVRCWGDVIDEVSLICARYREYLAMRDVTDLLYRFAREQALSVIHLWNAPEDVKKFLETGDETLRDEARAIASRVGADSFSGVSYDRAFATNHERKVGSAAYAAASAAYALSENAWDSSFSSAASAAYALSENAWDSTWFASRFSTDARASDSSWDAAWNTARDRFGQLVNELFDIS